MPAWMEEGSRAPAFSLPADDGSIVALKNLRGRKVVVYFYPKDDTPGCTREACAFRDRRAELEKLGVTVLGVSADNLKSHGKFRDKYQLNFPLLADVDHRTAEAFGAWQEKSLYGRKYWGIQRSTFLIDADGVVRHAWRTVRVDGHDDEVLAAVRALDSAPPPTTTARRTTAAKPTATKPTASKPTAGASGPAATKKKPARSTAPAKRAIAENAKKPKRKK